MNGIRNDNFWWKEKNGYITLDLSEKPEQFKTLEDWNEFIQNNRIVIVDTSYTQKNTSISRFNQFMEDFKSMFDTFKDMYEKNNNEINEKINKLQNEKVESKGKI